MSPHHETMQVSGTKSSGVSSLGTVLTQWSGCFHGTRQTAWVGSMAFGEAGAAKQSVPSSGLVPVEVQFPSTVCYRDPCHRPGGWFGG